MKNLLGGRIPDLSRFLKPELIRKPVGAAALTALLERVLPGGSRPSAPPSPDLGETLDGSFTAADGTRPYRLYLPRHKRPGCGMVVMLHGCTQSPDDFAAGTRMNTAAEAAGWLVLYPGQIKSANAQKCWNWFQAGDQKRGHGEPAIIAGMTREVMDRHAVDPDRAFVAGLSAGAAAAMILASAYPELYAAAGVHSGLAAGAAHDMGSAFAAMAQGRPGAPGGKIIPVIVFHGDRDRTVNPANADAVLAQAIPGNVRRRSIEDQVEGGHRYTRTVLADADGRSVAEQWVIHGAGHAWSGGSPTGSYTDPQGPDATKEMLRFFMEQPAARDLTARP